MSIPDIRVYTGRSMVTSPVVITGTTVTNASGVARIYLTDDRTSTGKTMFNNIYSWATDIETSTPVNSRSMVQGVNYVDITVSGFRFTSVTVLGINVLGSVSSDPIAGATVRYIIIGD